MKPSEVTEPGRYGWAWTTPLPLPQGDTKTGKCNIVLDDHGRLMHENGILLSDVAKQWPTHFVEMWKVEST